MSPTIRLTCVEATEARIAAIVCQNRNGSRSIINRRRGCRGVACNGPGSRAKMIRSHRQNDQRAWPQEAMIELRRKVRPEV
jgi:hypothetical protein